MCCFALNPVKDADILCCDVGCHILFDSILKSDEELHQLPTWKGLWGWQ